MVLSQRHTMCRRTLASRVNNPSSYCVVRRPMYDPAYYIYRMVPAAQTHNNMLQKNRYIYNIRTPQTRPVPQVLRIIIRVNINLSPSLRTDKPPTKPQAGQRCRRKSREGADTAVPLAVCFTGMKK